MERAEADLTGEKPYNAKEGYVYSELAKAAFKKIKLFRSKGFSYTQICRAFEKNGLLPKKSNPYSLRAAFHRERRRLAREEEIDELLSEKTDSESNSTPFKTGKTAQTSKATTVAGHEDQKTANAAAKRERIRDMASLKVNIGDGQITKFSDGNFEY
jgi:DNA-binding transcriptional MerR regulator